MRVGEEDGEMFPAGGKPRSVGIFEQIVLIISFLRHRGRGREIDGLSSFVYICFIIP